MQVIAFSNQGILYVWLVTIDEHILDMGFNPEVDRTNRQDLSIFAWVGIGLSDDCGGLLVSLYLSNTDSIPVGAILAQRDATVERQSCYDQPVIHVQSSSLPDPDSSHCSANTITHIRE